MTEWISVSERHPEGNRLVWVCGYPFYGIQYPMIAVMERVGDWWDCPWCGGPERDHTIDPKSISHWAYMELPEFPLKGR